MLLFKTKVAAGRKRRLITTSGPKNVPFSIDKCAQRDAMIEKAGVSVTKTIQLPVSFLTATCNFTTDEKIDAFGQNVINVRDVDAYNLAGSDDVTDMFPPQTT